MDRILASSAEAMVNKVVTSIGSQDCREKETDELIGSVMLTVLGGYLLIHLCEGCVSNESTRYYSNGWLDK
jgi:hypothetical protein